MDLNTQCNWSWSSVTRIYLSKLLRNDASFSLQSRTNMYKWCPYFVRWNRYFICGSVNLISGIPFNTKIINASSFTSHAGVLIWMSELSVHIHFCLGSVTICRSCRFSSQSSDVYPDFSLLGFDNSSMPPILIFGFISLP